MELKIRIKQSVQYQQSTATAGYYQGNNPNTLVFTTGALPANRQWPGYSNYIDVTADAGDLFKLKLTWTTERDTSGSVNAGGFEQKKSASGAINFGGDAYRYLKAWLIDDVSAPLNSVDVQIWHMEGAKPCGVYENYVIKATDMQWCEGAVCSFDVNLKQKDEPLNCIKRTLISDNHQGWFNVQPGNGKKHPRFSYCNEIRPNGMLVAQWYIMSILFFITAIVVYTVFSVVLAVLGVLLIIGTFLQAVISILNALGLKADNPIDPNDINARIKEIKDVLAGGLFESFAHMYMETAGCGREHPAPLIRDYIKNVCDKCGIAVNDTTADIFFAQQITIQTSDPNRGVVTASNPHYNACYLYAQTKRGIRRFKNLSFLGFSNPNTTDFYITDNSPLLALDMFLDELKPLYNAEWSIKTINQNGQLIPHLYFKRKDYFSQMPGSYTYDLSANSADRNRILEGICYEWNGKKTPAYTEGLYTADAADTCGNEARRHMDGYVSFGNVDDNPTFEGKLDKRFRFGATKFRLDGASTDYIMDALQLSVNLSFLTLFVSGFALPKLKTELQEYADFALLLKDETCTIPKVLIWDGQSYLNAKCIRALFATTNNGGTPQINPRFNNPAQPWEVRHEPETFVIGSTLSGGGSAPNGVYEARGLLGGFIYQQPASLINYPMYMEPGYYDTMWDLFHWIDDPRLNPVLNQDWNVKLEMCCDDLKKLKVFNDAGSIALGEKVKLPDKFYTDGRITEITVSYDPGDDMGQYIELKGTR